LFTPGFNNTYENILIPSQLLMLIKKKSQPLWENWNYPPSENVFKLNSKKKKRHYF